MAGAGSGTEVRVRIIAATELTVPPKGFASPHRLAIVERMDGSHPTLVMVDGPLPTPGEIGRVFPNPEGRIHWSPEPKDPVNRE